MYHCQTNNFVSLQCFEQLGPGLRFVLGKFHEMMMDLTTSLFNPIALRTAKRYGVLTILSTIGLRNSKYSFRETLHFCHRPDSD